MDFIYFFFGGGGCVGCFVVEGSYFNFWGEKIRSWSWLSQLG